MITRGAFYTSRLAAFFAFLLFVTACGGGGGGSSFISEDETPIFTVALLDAQGNEVDTVTPAAPARVRAKFSKDGGNTLVTATTTAGEILPSTGTALTNDNGVAFFTLNIPPGTPKGAGIVTVASRGLTATEDFEVGESDLQIGYFDEDGVFIDNVIDIVPDGMLSALGRAQLTVAVLDSEGELVDEPQGVMFSSPCLSSGLASLDPPSPIATVNGRVSTSYIAGGCAGIDEITATIPGASGQAFGTIEVAPPDASGLLFVENIPSIIAVRGTGGFTQRKESSDVIFSVVDGNGNPLQGVEVTFELSSGASGATLSPESAPSSSNGQAITTVHAGDVSGLVRVIARITTEDGDVISNISDAITISTGLPVQSGVSLSLAPGESSVVENGMTQDGVPRILTVTMLDSFSKPAADGTEARFETEYGTIDTLCRLGTENGPGVESEEAPPAGKCSVLWSSSNPRDPASQENRAAVKTIFGDPDYDCKSHNGNSGACPDDLGYTRGGRSTVLVYALGQEAFSDPNNNGVMEPGEKDDFENLPEAFLDKNEDDAYTPALCDSGGGSTDQCLAGSEETWVDRNLNGKYDLDNNPAWYNGLACPTDGDGVYCSREPIHVRADTVLVLSAPDLSGDTWDVLLASGSSVVTTANQQGSYTAYIADQYNNRPPAGSTISVSATGGCKLTSASSFTVGDTSEPGAFEFSVSLEPSLIAPENNGEITVTLDVAGNAPFSEPITCNSTCGGTINDPDYCPDVCDVESNPPEGCLAQCNAIDDYPYCSDLCDGEEGEPDWCPEP